MKRIVSLLIVFAIIVSFCACGEGENAPTTMNSDIQDGTRGELIETIKDDITNSTNKQPSISTKDETIPEPTSISDIWDGVEIDEYFKFNYGSYDDYLSPKELADVVNMAAEMSAKPSKAVSKKMVLIHQTITTFDSETKKTFLVTTDGEIIREYAPVEFNGDYLHTAPYTREFFGNYIVGFELFSEGGTFIKKLDLIGPIHDLVVLDDETYLISYVSKGHNTLYFLFPDGSSQEWYFKRDTSPWPDTPMTYGEIASLPVDSREDGMSIGYMSEGLMGVHYVRGWDHYLFYYNEKGEQVINLSHTETPYKVYELGCFKDGQAEIKLVGVDEKTYVAVINTAGEFVGNPCLIND